MFVPKPFSPRNILKIVEKYLEENGDEIQRDLIDGYKPD